VQYKSRQFTNERKEITTLLKVWGGVIEP